MSRWRVLDLFCGGGGATAGYQRLGWHVTGVDLRRRASYCGDAFVCADAVSWLGYLVESGKVERFDLIHASPPCQRWADGADNSRHPDLITPLRPLLIASSLPYIIENVRRAPLLDRIMLCGGAFGLVANETQQLHRHRYFESNRPLMGLPCTRIRRHALSVVGHGTPSANRRATGHWNDVAEGKRAMGIDWLKWADLVESIPPAYTEFLGAQL